MDTATRFFLMAVLVPLWLLAGVVDYLCHRRTHIERNAGMRESALHVLMLGQIGLPMLMALFLEINALVLAVMLVMLVVHEVTAWCDVAYADKRRRIAPLEQHMHSLMEVLPLAAVALVGTAHWAQFLAVFGLGSDSAEWSLRWKSDALPGWYVTGLLLAVFALVILPYAEEFWRCVAWRRAHPDGLVRMSGAGDIVRPGRAGADHQMPHEISRMAEKEIR